ncbi:hypothetical protein CEXT_418451 [Caerostris extrusa]|uniref:Uncharacterized protein n=1 Tax=Caerostris extrusa TaxID=172846 RepID=A0AAV4MJF7_CAEEX|nr:hypothetical protein CEXT_418451 [Caerostris extrusa]
MHFQLSFDLCRTLLIETGKFAANSENITSGTRKKKTYENTNVGVGLTVHYIILENLCLRRFIDCISLQQAFKSLKLQNIRNFSGQQLRIIDIQITIEQAVLKLIRFYP